MPLLPRGTEWLHPVTVGVGEREGERLIDVIYITMRSYLLYECR